MTHSMPSFKPRRAFTLACDCCGQPLYLHDRNDMTKEVLVLYPSRDLAKIASSELPTPLPIIEIKITVDTYGT